MRANTVLSQQPAAHRDCKRRFSRDPGLRQHRPFPQARPAVVDKPGRRPSLPREDVFWLCVTILEELADTSPSATTRDPYVSMMLGQPRSMGSRLANAEPLPPEFQVHWFDNPDDAND